jgi:hypothetical protein
MPLIVSLAKKQIDSCFFTVTVNFIFVIMSSARLNRFCSLKHEIDNLKKHKVVTEHTGDIETANCNEKDFPVNSVLSIMTTSLFARPSRIA